MPHPAFQIETYFDLSDFEHKALFLDDAPAHVWDILPRIGPYLKKILQPGIHGTVYEGAFLIGSEIYLGPGAVIEPGAYVEGPVYLGAGTVVRHGAYVRGKVITGKNCIIGHSTEIKNSVLLNGAKIPHYNYIGDSLLGTAVNLGAGSRLANFKVYGNEIVMRHEGKSYPTGLRKFGAILGDKVSVGCNAVCNPGTMVGPNSIIYPLVNVRGIHSADTMLKE